MKDFKTTMQKTYMTYINQFLGSSFYSRKKLFKLSEKQSSERMDMMHEHYKNNDTNHWAKEFDIKYDATIRLLNFYTWYKILLRTPFK
jgi:hypothetical protein